MCYNLKPWDWTENSKFEPEILSFNSSFKIWIENSFEIWSQNSGHELETKFELKITECELVISKFDFRTWNSDVNTKF